MNDAPKNTSLATDCVIFGFDGTALKVLLVERGIEPYMGCWALPGGFMRPDESAEDCARRELREETGLSEVYLEQMRVFSEPGRDPRSRVVTIAFIALVRPEDHTPRGGDDARRAMWFDSEMLPPLAFDHGKIVDYARGYLRRMLRVEPLAFKLLDKYFSIDELRRVYEVINGTTYDRRNFQRKLMQTGFVDRHDSFADTGCEPQDIAMPSPATAEAAPTARGRRPTLFTFIKKKKTDPDEDGSIKDLFNF